MIMRKFLSLFAAMLVAFAVNADTDFAAPGYSCAADAAILSGSASASKFYLNETADPHHIVWNDVALSTNALATWTVTATRGCYVSVSLDLGPVYASNKHNFEVKIIDSNLNVRGTLSEGGENTASEQVKVLDGTILIPLAGIYTIELRNARDYGKGSIKNVILTYAADAPSEIIEVSSIELNKTTLPLEIEEVELLTATVLPDNATDPSVTWETSAPEVATVNENGFVTAIAEGTATITATAGEQSATCAVTVSARTIPNVGFTAPCNLSGKKAHLEGAIWKNEEYKLYGDGGHNINYGTASWTIHVTRPCTVTGVLNGVQGGQMFVLDLYNSIDELIGYIAQPFAYKWWAGDLQLDSVGHNTLTFPEVGDYTLKLRNTLNWSSAKVAGVTLTPTTYQLYLKPGVWETDGAKYAIYAYNNEGNTWSNFMALAEGRTNIYTATIPAGYGTVIFVRLNSGATEPTWDAKWNQTADLALGEDDLYSITGWGDPSSTGVWSSYADEPAPVVLEDGYYIAGIINGAGGWNVADLSADRQLNHSNEEYEEWYKDVTLAVGDGFKVVYVENNAISTWYPAGENYVVDADHAGDKTVYFRPDSLGGSGWHEGFIYVQPNPVQLTLVAGWNTVCLPYAAEIANVDAYEIQDINFGVGGGTISLTPMNGVLEPATAYLINAAAAGAHTATLMGGKVTTPVEVDGFLGNLSETPVVLYATDEDYGYFVLSGNEFHLLLGDATANVAQYKAYIRLGKASAPSVLRIIENTTNINNIEAVEDAVKFIQNGQLYIMKNGVVYDAMGATVK